MTILFDLFVIFQHILIKSTCQAYVVRTFFKGRVATRCTILTGAVEDPNVKWSKKPLQETGNEPFFIYVHKKYKTVGG